MAIDMDFVALSMAAEIVMVFDDQDARSRPLRAIEMRRRKAADAAPDNNQVIWIVYCVDLLDCERSVAQGMGVFKRSRMTASHAGTRRRIIAWLILRRRRSGPVPLDH